MRRALAAEPLTAEQFRSFGEVIEADPLREHATINRGYAQRFGDLARIDTQAEGGRTLVSIYRARPRALPFRVELLERHLLGSQTFVPLTPQPFLVIVAPSGAAPSADRLRCFRTAPGQGVNLTRGVWHHPLVALGERSDFLVLERRGPEPEPDCEEHLLTDASVWAGE